MYPEWVKTIVDGEIPPEHNGNNTVICHTHYRNRDAYLSGHIPGAIDIDTLALEVPETWNRHSPEELKKALEQQGINIDTTVILYGKFMAPDNADELPGAIFGNCGTDAYHMENYRNVDHSTREFHEIVEIWEEVCITPDKHLAFYCGTGWRGSEAFYNAWLMGWPRISFLMEGGLNGVTTPKTLMKPECRNKSEVGSWKTEDAKSKIRNP